MGYRWVTATRPRPSRVIARAAIPWSSRHSN